MKTLVLYDPCGDGTKPFFFELEGDQRRFADFYINADDDEDLAEELTNILFDAESGLLKVKKLNEPTKDWDFFITVGFVP